MKKPDQEMCACGQPLHYTNPAVGRLVANIVAYCGPTLPIEVDGRRYRVQRHYIALHGLRATDMEDLAAAGIIQKEEDQAS